MSDKYVTISLPKAIGEDIDELIEALGYWPSRGSFVREAAIDKIRKERKLVRELRENKGKPIKEKDVT